jgi:hypothetical protein
MGLVASTVSTSPRCRRCAPAGARRPRGPAHPGGLAKSVVPIDGRRRRLLHEVLRCETPIHPSPGRMSSAPSSGTEARRLRRFFHGSGSFNRHAVDDDLRAATDGGKTITSNALRLLSLRRPASRCKRTESARCRTPAATSLRLRRTMHDRDTRGPRRMGLDGWRRCDRGDL